MAAVGLKLSLAGAARTDRRRAAGGGLADKVRPHTCQAREQIFILRKLYLKLTLARLGALGEDIQYEPGAVEHLDAELLGQHAHLRGAEFVVEHGEVAVVHRDKLFHFPDLAVADEAARIRRRAALHEHGDSLAPRGLDKGGKLLHRHLGRALMLVHACGGQARKHSAFFFYLGIFHSSPQNIMSADNAYVDLPTAAFISNRSPTKWVRFEKEEGDRIVQFSLQGGNGTV